MVKSGLVLRKARTWSYMNLRCPAEAMSSGTASAPTGIYVNSQQNLAPHSSIWSKYSSLPITSAFLLV